MRSDSRSSINSGEDKKSVRSNSRPNLIQKDDNKEEKEKAEELAKIQRQIQEEKEKEKLKREQEKAERAKKE